MKPKIVSQPGNQQAIFKARIGREEMWSLAGSRGRWNSEFLYVHVAIPKSKFRQCVLDLPVYMHVYFYGVTFLKLNIQV